MMMMTTGAGRSTTATSGGGGGKFPFTASQWQELEHQALIYKYMAAGMPIPPDLLYSIKRNLDSSLSSKLFPYQTSPIGWNPYKIGLGYGGKKIDPEPGRCRRTDGKKWRCSKEAYPDSKYCERHMHRGKNRSRKPVETTTTSVMATTASTPTINNSLLANSSNTHHNYNSLSSMSIISPSLLSSPPMAKTHSSNSSSLSSDSSSTFHSLSPFPPVGLASSDTNNSSLHYGRQTDHHHHHRGSSYDVTTSHFLYPHSSTARPHGNIDLSNQDRSTGPLLFGSGASFRERYVHGMKEEMVVGEHAFFTESSGSMRGFSGSSSINEAWENHHQQEQNQNPLKMGASHSSLDNTKQSGYPYLELNKSEILKQDHNSKQQLIYVWGRDFSSEPMKVVERDNHRQHHHGANEKTIHHFFDEWPPKGGGGSGGGDGRDSSSPWHDSTTQLSISMPTPSHDFFLSSSRAHNGTVRFI